MAIKKNKQVISERRIAFVAVVISVISFVLVFFRIDMPMSTHISLLPDFITAFAASVTAYAAIQALTVWKDQKYWDTSISILNTINSINSDVEFLTFAIKNGSMTSDIFYNNGKSLFFRLERLKEKKDDIFFPFPRIRGMIEDLAIEYEVFNVKLFSLFTLNESQDYWQRSDFDVSFLREIERKIKKKSEDINHILSQYLK